MRRDPRERLALIGLILAPIAGCGLGDDPPALVVATTWPPGVRAQAESLYHRQAGPRAIRWVALGAGPWASVLDRRGGVDLIAGGSARDLLPLLDAGRLERLGSEDAVPWRVVDRPPGPADRREATADPAPALADPRADPDIGAEARRVLGSEGWGRGFATLARRVDRRPPGGGSGASIPAPGAEILARPRDGQQADQAGRFASALASAGWARPAPPDAERLARVDDLLADLLASALVEARAERRDALEALARSGHPEAAESALGQLPPWPPASVARLLAEPTHQSLVEALLAQVAPDLDARAWLRASWGGPRRVVDPGLLGEIAAASGGRLAREPRFRAWLRGEWVASMQQHYRRVARLAGGYRPS